jgi:hypothetical protein
LNVTPIHSYDDLVAAVRARQDELNVSCLTIDEIAGTASGHFSKITCNLKQFGLRSLFLFLPALGLKLQIVPDPDAIARYGLRWLPRYGGSGNHWRRYRPTGLDSQP